MQPPIISVSTYMEMSGEKQEEAFHPLIAWEVCADPLVQLFSCKTPSWLLDHLHMAVFEVVLLNHAVDRHKCS